MQPIQQHFLSPFGGSTCMKAVSPGRCGPVRTCLVNRWDESSGKVPAEYWELRKFLEVENCRNDNIIALITSPFFFITNFYIGVIKKIGFNHQNIQIFKQISLNRKRRMKFIRMGNKLNCHYWALWILLSCRNKFLNSDFTYHRFNFFLRVTLLLISALDICQIIISSIHPSQESK